ncbi:RNB domain-containing ribonuclease [Actinoplanes sp. NEAU-A12]|uniref:RNB domain-containing ribonuclease n=1 Tax=Actinoplanes sandaracinus TaxID=3045177 RepID=A0ABT6WED8_9ACTN|nr:RNB domain-containing ribonuclease [Actinoplanes sandaracinus]MDI6098091.1 RNB domain-containing ribonuclease [Actinoplanes sandaracinus]
MPIKRMVAPQIDFSALRRELGLPGEFPEAVLAEAGEAARATPLPEVDRTGIAFVTIDPATSRDLDQAMHLSRRGGGGYRIRYAIADVASYVRPGGPIEAESWVRGQTVYLPDGRIPLHPPVLSEDAVSLLPGGDRAAVVWTIDLDSDGETVAVDVERARVRSRAKLDYAGVQRQVDAGTAPEELALLPEIGGLLARRASDRGAVNLPLPSQEVERDSDGWRLVLRAPLPIEEHNAQISLLTGMAAARIMLDGGIGLLRTMPAPKPEAVAKLRSAAAPLGIRWPDGARVGEVVAAVDPADPRGAAFLDQAAELLRGAAYTAFGAPAPAGLGAGDPHTPAEQDGRDTPADTGRGGNVGRADAGQGGDVRRADAGQGGGGSGAEAERGGAGVPADVGHGGVGAAYAHVTAPLRRLADRYATEICLSLYAGRPVPEWVAQALPRLPKAMSSTDRVASAADRGAIDLAEAVLLQGRVGEVFEAAVLDRDEPNGKRPAGGTIALDEPAVRAKCLGDLPLGRRIGVRLTAADPASRTVRFERS